MMKQLLEGFKFLHKNGVMHRVLKLSNILINRKGELKICDFGLSSQFESECGLYSFGVITLWYRALEILAGVETYFTVIVVGWLHNGRIVVEGSALQRYE
ncbi:UNVERIFIED_CONTAM: Cyclin-dependent kinase G-1 [Sesamum latifolium]|uniref:Cyclin-dependent kinase G-1 n=1 Tax=Sesamum latifolium TaxID=2727402 RepID=A0AAW2XI22_9LAMI